MSGGNQDETLRRQFQQLQEQQQRRLQLAQQQRSAKMLKQTFDDGSDKQTSSFNVVDDMDLTVRE